MAGTRKLNQNGLTNKVQRIYDFIVEEQERVGYPPSVREICEYMGLKSTSSSHSYLKLLEAKWLIKRDPTKPRALEIISNKTEQQCKIIHAPIHRVMNLEIDESYYDDTCDEIDEEVPLYED